MCCALSVLFKAVVNITRELIFDEIDKIDKKERLKRTIPFIGTINLFLTQP